MRDFNLCKAKRKDTKEWVEGYYFYSRHNIHMIIEEWNGYYGTDSHFSFYEVIPETVSRLTPFVDMEKQKIWENDLVVSPAGEIFQVLFADGAFTLNGYRPVMGLSVSFSEHISKFYRVIGNIFDNPELLEGEK